MKKLIEKTLMVSIGLGLALYFHLGLYQRPVGMVGEEQVNVDSNGVKTIQLQEMNIIGIKRRIDFGSADQGSEQINQLWEGFFGDTMIQSLVSWSQPQSVIAYYDDFTEDGSSAILTIGFPESIVAQTDNYLTVALPQGKYVLYPIEPPTVAEVNAVWDQISSGDVFPQVVIERYAMDTMGQPQEIQMQALFQ